MVSLLWLNMLDLRTELREAIAEKKTLLGIHEEGARQVMDVRMFRLRSRIQRCDKAYHQFAEPFLDRYGRPPLGDG